MKKTILHVSETAGSGGAETVLAQIATRFRSPEFESVAAGPNSGWLQSQLELNGVRFEHFEIGRRNRFPVDITLLRDLIRLIRVHRIDLIHSHCFGISVYAAAAALLTRTPVVCTFHGDPDLARSQKMRALKYFLISTCCDAIVAVSTSLRDKLLRETPLEASRCRTIHNGISPPKIATATPNSLRARMDVEPSAFLIGAVGNIRSSKGYEVLLRAAVDLVHRYPSVQVVVIGDTSTPLSGEMLALRDALGLQRFVRFMGFRDDARELMTTFDAFVLPSHNEGFSLATLQALSAGIPVVATRCGGPEEMIRDEVDGLLVPTGDPAAITQALSRLIESSQLRGRLAVEGQAMAAKVFSLDRMLNEYDELYRRVLGMGPAAETRGT